MKFILGLVLGAVIGYSAHYVILTTTMSEALQFYHGYIS